MNDSNIKVADSAYNLDATPLEINKEGLLKPDKNESNNNKSIDDNEEYASDDNFDIIEDNADNKKSMCNRYFSKMDAGSLRSSIFSLCILSVGVGTLALPQIFGYLSVLLATFMIILGAFTTYWTLDVLIIAGRKKHISSYPDLVNFYCGKAWSLVLNLNLILYILGVLIVYQITAYKMIGGFVYAVGSWDKEKYYNLDIFLDNSIWSNTGVTIGIMMGVATLLLPLFLLRDISKLRFSTVFGLLCLVVIMIVIVIELPEFLKQNNENNIKYNWYDVSKSFNSDFNFFRGIGTIFFAYNCHSGVFPVYDRLFNNSKRRHRKTFNRSMILDVIFFLVIGITGYLTQPDNTPTIIINRNALNKGSKDILMTICRVLIFCLIIVKNPVNYNCLRVSIFDMLFKTTEIDNKR